MKYFYFWGLIFVFPFTLYSYLKADKSLRIKIFISGLGFGILSVLLSYICYDYFKPVYFFNYIRLEDFLYGFLFAGIIPIAHNLFNKTKIKGKYSLNWQLAIIDILLFIASFYFLWYKLKINSIYVFCIIPVIVGFLSFIIVKGTIKDILITILASTFITVFVYNIIYLIYPKVYLNHYLLKNVSNIILLNVPLEEWLFAISLGIGCTYTYEAIFKLKK